MLTTIVAPWRPGVGAVARRRAGLPARRAPVRLRRASARGSVAPTARRAVRRRRHRLACFVVRRRVRRRPAAAGAAWRAPRRSSRSGSIDDVLSLKPATKLIVADRARLDAAVLRLPPELARVDDARHPADARLGRRDDERVQPARQHGRPVRRHRASSSARRSWSICCLAPPARGRSRRRATSRFCSARPAGFLVYNLPPGVDLHGRQRQPAARLQLRRGHAQRRSTRRRADRTSCRSSRRRCSCC